MVRFRFEAQFGEIFRAESVKYLKSDVIVYSDISKVCTSFLWENM